MTTYNLRRGGNSAIAGVADPGVYVLRKQLSFANSPKLANDVLQLFDIPAGTVVQSASWNVKTAEGATLTFDVGDDGSTTQYASAVNGNSSGRGALVSTPKFFTIAGLINLTLHNNAANAVIEVCVHCVDMFSMPGAGGQNETPNIVTGGE